MPMVIDGHNLIGKMSTISLADPDDEEKLVRILARHLLHTRQKVIVVFDKGADIDFSPVQRGPRLRVMFAPPESSADAMIIDMIRKDPNPKGMTIVSSDNEIRRCARNRRARLVSAEDFARKLESEPETQGKPAPLNQKGNIDIQEWLEYFKGRKS
ncbi:MAG: NYN domain-containing protein [Candidatus Abyssubacteria bacterium]